MTDTSTDTTMWEAAWQEGNTGWDAGQPAPSLVALLDREELPTGRALVPGCGAGYDVFALAKAGFEAYGLDIAPTASQRFEEKRAGLEGAHIITDDFFQPETDLGTFALIWDYTFLCAIPPSLRENWAQRMSQLLGEGGTLVTLIFPVKLEDTSETTEEDPGPPYRLHPDWVTTLLGKYGLTRVHIEPASASHPGREGMEHLAMWRRE